MLYPLQDGRRETSFAVSSATDRTAGPGSRDDCYCYPLAQIAPYASCHPEKGVR